MCPRLCARLRLRLRLTPRVVITGTMSYRAFSKAAILASSASSVTALAGASFDTTGLAFRPILPANSKSVLAACAFAAAGACFDAATIRSVATASASASIAPTAR